MFTHRGRWALAATLTAAVIAGSALPAGAAVIAGSARPAGGTQTDGGDGRLQRAADDLHRLGVTGVQALARTESRHGVRTVRARAGVGDLERGIPVPVDGFFRMGSNTKTYVSVVVLQLVGERQLSLDDTVERWLPGVVTGNGNDGSKITVRQLLRHTSGIYNYTSDVPALTSYAEFQAHHSEHWDAAELVALALKHEPDFAPGTHWDYSNTNYVLAGMIIERVTGRPWATEVRDRILRPLGLRETSAPGDRETLPGPHARGYQQWEPGGALTDTTEFNPSAADAAGALVTTPSDLARFWQALQRGQLLKPRQMAQLHETVLAETFQDWIPGLRYGLGIMYVPNRCGGYWAHGGDVPGMSTSNAVSPDGSRVAVVANSTELADDTAARAVDARTRQLLDDVICG